MTLHSLSSPIFSSLYVAFVFIDPCGATRCRCTLTVILWPRLPIFRWCNTILQSWGDRWSPMLMLYSLCGNSKEIKGCMWYECHSRRGQCRRVSNDKSRKGFYTCVEEATGRLLRRSNTEARTPDRGRCLRSEVCAVMKEPSKNAALSRRGLSKGNIKIALVRWLASLPLFQWITQNQLIATFLRRYGRLYRLAWR
jgi:hypothetical protein